MIDDKVRNDVWEKGKKDSKYSEEEVRIDACGAYIVRWCTHRENDFAWEVDHIIPVSKLMEYDVPEDLRDDIVNLRPLNWHNNVSKGDDCPNYKAIYTRKGESNVPMPNEKTLIVNSVSLREALKFYKSKGYDIKL